MHINGTVDNMHVHVKLIWMKIFAFLAQEPRVVQLISNPYLGSEVLRAGPAQFGLNLKNQPGVSVILLCRLKTCYCISVIAYLDAI